MSTTTAPLVATTPDLSKLIAEAPATSLRCETPDTSLLRAEIEAGAVTQGTAYTIVQEGDQPTIPDFDLYVCNPSGFNTTTMEANTPPSSLKLFYTICGLMPAFAGAYWVGQRAAANLANDGDYVHTAGTPGPLTRVVYDGDPNGLIGPPNGHWMVRPSASLGARIAAYIVGATSTYFDGAMSDESYAAIPSYYWDKYKTAVDPVLHDSDKPAWDLLWYQMISTFLAILKFNFGGGVRAIIANSAGDTWAGIDGITIEASHIQAMGEGWARAAFEAQKLLWVAGPDKFPNGVQNVAWDYDMNIADLVYRGSTIPGGVGGGNIELPHGNEGGG